MTNIPDRDSHTKIKAVGTSLSIVETLADEGPLTITELAETLDRSPSNVLAHLRTLRERGFAVREDGQFRLGLRYYELGNTLRTEYPLSVHGTEPADDLASETGEYVWLMVQEQGRGYFLYKSGGDNAVESGAYTLGSRWHLNSTASGKAVLAHMDSDRVDEILDDHGFGAMTPNTITDRAELKRELATIREAGFARDEEESAVGIRGVAAPVRGLDGVIGAISISGPTSRIQGETFDTTLPEKVQEAADIIRIKYNGASAVDR